jgi:hypothetical protein
MQTPKIAQACLNPIFLFIKDVSISLCQLGAPGLEETKIDARDMLIQGMERGGIGLIDEIVYPMLSSYILHAWMLEHWVASEEYKEGRFRQGKGYCHSLREDARSEWGIVLEFVRIALHFRVHNLSLLPPFYGHMPKNSPSYVEWTRDRVFDFLYTFDRKSGHTITAQARQPDLFTMLNKTVARMARLEDQLRRFLVWAEQRWQKLTKDGPLESEYFGPLIEEEMALLVKRWPDAFLMDRELKITAHEMTFASPVQVKKRQGSELRKEIDKAYSQKAGIRRGNIGRVEKDIEPSTEELIAGVIPDLKEILRLAWPITNEVDQKAAISRLTLCEINSGNWDFLWESLDYTDKLGFCTKIVVRYLTEKTGSKYAQKSIETTIKRHLRKK